MSSPPVITRAGTSPRVSRKLFVNVPVSDVQRSIRFFEALDFVFNPQFTDAAATCMLVGQDAYFMLMTQARFLEFTGGRPMGNPQRETNALFAVTAESREQVDAVYARALEAGGTSAREERDHGFMYVRSFKDLDGYTWEVFWMDPSAVNG